MKWTVKLAEDDKVLGTVDAASYAEALGAACVLAGGSAERPQRLLVTPANLASNEALWEHLRQKSERGRRRS
jgi:hypothetical protein